MDPQRPLLLRAPAALWWLTKRTAIHSFKDGIFTRSAQAAFWQTLSLPPLLLALLGFLGYVAGWFGADTLTEVQDQIIEVGGRVLAPSVVDDILAPMVDQVLGRGRADVASVGFFISLWAGSSAVSAFVDAIVQAHGQSDIRHPVRQRLFSLVLYLGFLCLAIVTLPVIALGPAFISRHMPPSWHPIMGELFGFGYFPVVILGLIGALSLLYRVALPRPLPWARLLIGATIAGCFFVIASFALRRYLAYVGGSGYSYGALATPIAFLLFSFFVGFAVMLGAEINASIQERWPAKGTRTDQFREWLSDQVAGTGLDERAKVATDQLKKIATAPIPSPQRRRDERGGELRRSANPPPDDPSSDWPRSHRR